MPNTDDVTSSVLYQSERLSAYAERLIHCFTGKPLTFGGPGFDRAEILANRRALCEHFNLDADKLVVPEQTHSATSRPNHADGFCQTDAVILVAPGVPALVQTADCVPVMLYEPEAHIGAVIHAGWRGTAQGITALTARRLLSEYGCRAERLIAVIGPAISGCCYQVSEDVATAVSQTVQVSPERFMSHNCNGKPHVDLKIVNRLQLEALGVSNIDTAADCTRCQADTLWSHRRGESGRQVALMALHALH